MPRHRLFNLVLAASMSLFVVTFTPFAWSFLSEDEWTISSRQTGVDYSRHTIELSRGYFMFTRYQGRVHPNYTVGEGVTVDSPPSHFSYAPHRDALDYDDVAGFGISHRRQRDGPAVRNEQTLFIPLWPMLLISLILPTIQFGPRLPPLLRRLAEPKRHPPGICITCHYNLTGNTSGTCPECGTAIIPKAGP